MKGITNNPNGRPKGKPNKVTATMRESISNFCSDNWLQVQKDFDQLEPKERIQAFERFLQYTIPKRTESQMKIDFEQMTEEQINDIVEQLIGKVE